MKLFKKRLPFWSVMAWISSEKKLEVWFEWEEDYSNESNGYYTEGDCDFGTEWIPEQSRLSFRRCIDVCKDSYGFRIIVPWFVAFLFAEKYGFRYRLKQLFCKHDFDTRYYEFEGYIKVCKKCGKFKKYTLKKVSP